MKNFSVAKWEVNDYINARVINDLDGNMIGLVIASLEYSERSRVNAKLITLAPEMYELLRKIIARTDKLGTGAPFGFIDLFGEAREILACINRKQEAQS